MTATSITPTVRHISAPARSAGLVRTGLAASVAASAATATTAAIGSATGISLNVAGEPIPVAGFATLTAICSLIGLVLAAALSRYAGRPRHTFVRITVVLTALSFVPDLAADAAASTKALLMLTHVVAAVIVVPPIARRLSA